MQKALLIAFFLGVFINLFFVPVTSKVQKIIDTNCQEGGYNELTHRADYYYQKSCPRGFITKRIPVWTEYPATYELDILLFMFQAGITVATFMGITYAIYNLPTKKN